MNKEGSSPSGTTAFSANIFGEAGSKPPEPYRAASCRAGVSKSRDGEAMYRIGKARSRDGAALFRDGETVCRDIAAAFRAGKTMEAHIVALWPFSVVQSRDFAVGSPNIASLFASNASVSRGIASMFPFVA